MRTATVGHYVHAIKPHVDVRGTGTPEFFADLARTNIEQDASNHNGHDDTSKETWVYTFSRENTSELTKYCIQCSASFLVPA